MAKAGIETGKTLDYAVFNLPFNLQYCRQSYDNAACAVSEIANLPNYPSLMDKKAYYIAAQTVRIVKEAQYGK